MHRSFALVALATLVLTAPGVPAAQPGWLAAPSDDGLDATPFEILDPQMPDPLLPDILPPDGGEPDSCGSPRAVASGSTIRGIVNPSNDEDFYAIDVPCGGTLRVDVLPVGGTLNPAIMLFGPSDPACSVRSPAIEAQPSFLSEGAGKRVILVYHALAGGTYRVRVGSASNSTATFGHHLGAYDVAFAVTPGPCSPLGDGCEPDDSCAAARPAFDDLTESREILPGEADHYSMALGTGENLFVKVTPLTGTLRPAIDIWAPGLPCTATPTWTTSAASAGASVRNLRISPYPPDPATPGSGVPEGVFTIRIRSAPGTSTSGPYRVTFVKYFRNFATPDALEPDDVAAACRPLPPVGGIEARTLAPLGEEDWYCVELACGERLALSTLPDVAGNGSYVGNVNGTDTSIEIFAPDGRQLASDNDGGPDVLSRLAFTAPADGRYFVRIRWGLSFAFAYYGLGGYSLSTLSRDPAERLDVAVSQATTPALGTQLVADARTDETRYSKVTGATPLIDISPTGRNLGLGNETVAVVDLPFPFDYMGKTWTQLAVSDNGFVTFEEFLVTSRFGTNPCPWPDSTFRDPKGVIAPFWDDLRLTLPGSGVFVETLGAPGSRQLVVLWKNLSLASGGSHTFELLLEEGTNRIEFRYDAMGGSAASSGSSASIGIEDESGTRGVAHACNASGAVASGLSLLFTPPAGGTTPWFRDVPTYDLARDAEPLIDISGTGTPLTLGDDAFATLALPFPFAYFGVPRSSVNVVSNGYLTLGAPSTSASNACSLVSPAAPNDVVAPLWDDWDPTAGGGVYWQVMGSPGSRMLVVQWDRLSPYRSATDTRPRGSHTFQAILLEGSNAIEFRYGALAGAPESDGSWASIGLENASGSHGVSVSCNVAGIAAEGVRLTFTPGLAGPAHEWRDAVTDDLLATGPAYFVPAEDPCDVKLVTLAPPTPDATCAQRDERIVTVPDIFPPAVAEGSEDLHCLWPPDHRPVTFTVAQFAPEIADNCAAPPSWRFVDCAADQDGNGRGDGNTDGDCVVAPDGLSFTVLAERSGNEPDGRRYAVTIVAADDAGNESPATRIGSILVPHDRSAHAACRVSGLAPALAGPFSPRRIR